MEFEVEEGRAMHGKMERRRQSKVFHHWGHRKVGEAAHGGCKWKLWWIQRTVWKYRATVQLLQGISGAAGYNSKDVQQ